MAKQKTSILLAAHTRRQLALLAERTGWNQSEIITVAIDRMAREGDKMRLYIYCDAEADNALARFPYQAGQYIAEEGDTTVVITLGDRNDTTAAQEQFLNTNPHVVEWQIVDSRGCAHGNGVCPAAIDAAGRNVVPGVIVECPHCHRVWRGGYAMNAETGVATWQWK